jgi:predicted RNA binding protein YcfA (HicA-like mRNA interferase family)
MRLPRDIAGRDLARALGVFGYEVVRQSGSHIRLTSRLEPQHHLTIPDNAALRVGTLAAVVADVAAHHGLRRDEVLDRLFPKS